MIMNRLNDSCTPDASDPITEGDNPSHKRWHLLIENYGAARRALFAAKVQLA